MLTIMQSGLEAGTRPGKQPCAESVAMLTIMQSGLEDTPGRPYDAYVLV